MKNRVEEFLRLRELAELATGHTATKWYANKALVAWFRSNPLAVVDVLVAAARCGSMPGGLNTQALKAAVVAVQPCPTDEEVTK